MILSQKLFEFQQANDRDVDGKNSRKYLLKMLLVPLFEYHQYLPRLIKSHVSETRIEIEIDGSVRVISKQSLIKRQLTIRIDSFQTTYFEIRLHLQCYILFEILINQNGSIKILN